MLVDLFCCCGFECREDEEKEAAQYSIYIPVVGSAPHLETGQKTQPVLLYIAKVHIKTMCCP